VSTAPGTGRRSLRAPAFLRPLSAALVAGSALVAFAAPQLRPPASPSDFAATIDHHYNALHSLSANFTQQYDGLGMHRTESGTLLLKRSGKLAAAGGKMRWTYSRPAGKLFVMDGHDAYFYTPGQTEIPRVAAKKLDDLRSPLAYLLGHAELARELTDLSLQHADAGDWTLTGVPRGMEKRIASLSITATADGTIATMRVEETDGAINTFHLSNEQPNPPAPASAFIFNMPPGTHLVDGMPPL
jgi:outer membrane lipoprotein carrier protein